jgi:hypothetical protein
MKNLRIWLEKVTKKIESIRSSVERAWSTYAIEVGKYIDNIEYTLQLLKKHYQLDVKEIIGELQKIRKSISIKDASNLQLKLSEIEQTKNKIHQSFYKLIKPMLEENEVKLLELVVKKSREEGKEWLSEQELYQIMSSELNIQLEEANKILQKLVEQGVLKKGISLSF